MRTFDWNAAELTELKRLARNFMLVDLEQAELNTANIKRYIGAKTKLLAVVKSNAYGHGLVECAEAFVRGGADYLGVAAADAALYLRKAGVKSPILIFSEAEQLDYASLVRNDIEPAIYSSLAAKKLSAAAKKLGKKARFQLAIDTGMSRIGFNSRLLLSTLQETNFCKASFTELKANSSLFAHLSVEMQQEAQSEWQAIKEILSDENLLCQGVFSHFAKADCLGKEAQAKTHEQYLLLDALSAYLQSENYAVPLRHICNSAATVSYPAYYMDMVRPGSILYGLAPANSAAKLPLDIRPIATWYARIARIFVLPANETVSYGGLYKSSEDTLIAVLAVGYADGYRRNLTNKAYVLLPSGEKAEVLGRICMDYCMVKLPWSYAKYLNQDISQLAPVELLGDGCNGAPTADDLAKLGDSFNLEVCCNIASRVKRVYLSQGKINNIKSYLFDC